MPEFTDKQKMDTVARQRQLFGRYLIRLANEKKLTPEQDKTGMVECMILDEIIEDYKAKIGAANDSEK